MAIQGNNFKERILSSFDIYENHLNGHKDSPQHKVRVDAIKHFEIFRTRNIFNLLTINFI